jgi:hypothetical protein
MGSFDFAAYEELLMPFLKVGDDYSSEYDRVAQSHTQKISLLRSKVILELVKECAAEFLKNEDALLSGVYEGGLIKSTPSGAVVVKAKKIGLAQVYHHEKKQYAEIAAFEIIDGSTRWAF